MTVKASTPPPPWCWDESAQSAVLRLRPHDGSLVIHHHRTYQFLFQREISASSSLKGWKFTIWWLIRLKISNPTLSIPKIFGRRYSDISLVIQMNPRRYAMHFSMATRDQSVITMCQTDDVFRPNLFQWIILKLWNEKRGAGQVLSIDQSTSLKKLKAAALGGEMNDGTPAMEGSIEPEQPFDLIEEGDIAINIYHNVPPDFSRTTRLSTWTTWNQDVSFLAFSGFISAGIHRHSCFFLFF